MDTQKTILISNAMKDLPIWNSLKHKELVVAIEQTLGIELTFEEIVAIRSVREINRVFKEKGVSA